MDNRPAIYANGRYLTQPLSGIQRYAHNLAQRLPMLRLVTPSPPLPIYKGIAEDRLTLAPSMLKSHLWEQVTLPRSVARDKVLWSPTSAGPISFPNHVLTIHDLSHIEYPEWYGRTFGRWYRLVHPLAARRARHIICVSEYTKQRVMELFGVPAERLTVIYEGLDDIFQRPPQAEVDAEIERRGLRRPYLITVGSISPRKNFERLLQAWSSLREKAAADLVIVGRPNLFFSRGGKLGVMPPRTTHLTDVDDISLVRLIAGARAFLYPSLYEGFGLPILEAMAIGTPVLTSNTTSMPEVAGDAALLVDPYDVDAIAGGISRLLSDDALCAALAARGAAQVTRFSWDQAAKQTWDVLSRYVS